AFIFNRSMELAGGSWIWSASLRYYFMFILLLIYLRKKKYIVKVNQNKKKEPLKWIVWITLRFGLFYSTLSYATVHAPGWLVAATFQLNIVAGSLLTPIINKENKSIPIMSVLISFIIIAGVAVIQMEHVISVAITRQSLTI